MPDIFSMHSVRQCTFCTSVQSCHSSTAVHVVLTETKATKAALSFLHIMIYRFGILDSGWCA